MRNLFADNFDLHLWGEIEVGQVDGALSSGDVDEALVHGCGLRHAVLLRAGQAHHMQGGGEGERQRGGRVEGETRRQTVGTHAHAAVRQHQDLGVITFIFLLEEKKGFLYLAEGAVAPLLQHQRVDALKGDFQTRLVVVLQVVQL